MRLCTDSSFPAPALSVGALAGLTYPWQSFLEQLTIDEARARSVSNKFVTVPCAMTLTPNEIRARLAGFWKKDESSIQSWWIMSMLFFGSSSCNSVLPVNGFRLGKGYSDDLFSYLYGPWVTMATFCSAWTFQLLPEGWWSFYTKSHLRPFNAWIVRFCEDYIPPLFHA